MRFKLILASLIFLSSLVSVASELQLRHATGLVLPDNWKDTGEFSEITKEDIQEVVTVPFFDLRNEIPGGLMPVRNQRKCGSCWAFSVTATMESAILFATGVMVDLSEQELVSRCSSSGSCNGGYFSAHNYQKSPGLAFERDFPYTASNGPCKQVSHDHRIISWHYIGNRDNYRSPSYEEVKAAIWKFGMLSVTVTANGAMSNYDGGIFGEKPGQCSNGGTNHMVNLIGWNDERHTYLMRNSWGENWGMDGYMEIKPGCSRIAEVASVVEYLPAAGKPMPWHSKKGR